MKILTETSCDGDILASYVVDHTDGPAFDLFKNGATKLIVEIATGIIYTYTPVEDESL